MRFSTPLVPARLIRRYKRFLADCVLDTGLEVTAHCPNPGSMLGMADPGMAIWLEPNADPRKKLRYGWRLIDHEDGHFTGIDTSLPNRVIGAALTAHLVPGLAGYDTVRPEVAYGTGSRADFQLSGPSGRIWVEVKSVTLSRQQGLAEFPDCVTARGARHMHDLADVVRAGDRAVLVFLVQRTDATHAGLAADIDPAYARAFATATTAGVQVLALGTTITPIGIDLAAPLVFKQP